MGSVEESTCIVRIRGANAAVSLGYEILEAYLISSIIIVKGRCVLNESPYDF